MKKSDIEKQLQQDLSAAAPSDFSAVWDKCETPASEHAELSAELVPAAAGGARSAPIPFRRPIPYLSLALAVLMIIAAILCLTLPNKSGNGLVLPSSGGYFTVDVNPSLRVNYGIDGVVSLAEGLNADGEELLEGLDLEGMTYDKAADAIFDACESRGYFSASRDDNAILMTASKDTGEKDEQITAELKKIIAQKFTDKKMTGAVITDVDNSKGEKDAEKYGISGQKYELIQSYLGMGGALDESEYQTVTIRELYAKISELEKNGKEK